MRGVSAWAAGQEGWGGGLTRGLSESRLRMRLVNTDKEPVKKRRWGSIPHERGGQVHLGQLCAGQTP